jgi:type II secretion system protein I
MRPRQARLADAGFTLLETLVALAILGIVLTTVFGVIGSGLRAAHRDEDRLLLGLVAQNLLVRSRLDLTTDDGPRSGDIGGGLVWRIESEPYVPPDDILPPPPDPDADRGLRARDGEDGGMETAGADRTEDAGSSTFNGDRAERQESELGDGAATTSDRPSLGDRDAGRGGSGGGGRAEVKLRLVRVTVEKGGQRFELTGLAAEPRREPPGRL